MITGASKDKRKSPRVQVSLPVRVRGIDAQGLKFEEVTHSIDLSRDGVLFLLKQAVSRGMRLDLSLPLPRGMQKTGASHSVYRTIGIVVRVKPTGTSGSFEIAVRFSNGSAKQYHLEVHNDGE